MVATQDLNYGDPVSGRIDASVPRIASGDLSKRDWRLTVPAAADACERLGFLCLDLEPRSRRVLDAVLQAMQRFFVLPDPEKAPFEADDAGHGWTPSFREPAYQPGTISNVESFDVRRSSVEAGNGAMWPQIRGFRDVVADCWNEYLRIGDAVLELLARVVEITPDCFAANCGSRELNTLRLLHYPGSAAASTPADVGIAAHTDFECITLLYQTAPGLELRRTDGAWIDAPTAQGTLIVLLNDMLETWTNGRIQATGHRVRRTSEERFSIVMFVAVDDDVTVAPLPSFVSGDAPARYAAVRQREHIHREMERARSQRVTAPPS